MVTHEFLFYKGCVYYCISWTPLDLLGVGFETSLRKQVSPLTVIVGLGRNLGVGSSGTTIDAAVGVELSIPSPVHPSLRLLCIALTEKSEDGCPCKELKPASIGEYAE
jgi:hypothetical protein